MNQIGLIGSCKYKKISHYLFNHKYCKSDGCITMLPCLANIGQSNLLKSYEYIPTLHGFKSLFNGKRKKALLIVKLGSRPWPGPTQLNSPTQSLISDSKGLDLR